MSNIPTLALIPSAYNTSKVYSVLPSNGDGDFAFSRNGEATRINQAGVIETVGSNVPRLDYSDSSCPSLLLEPQRTNLQVNSEEFDNSLWDKNRASITPNDVISPSGLLNADKITGTSGTSSYVYDGITVTNGSIYAISVFFKYIDISEVSIFNFTQNGEAYFNIENGTVISNSGTITEPKIENYGNGWYRCSVKFTATADESINYGFLLNNAIGKSVHIWGAQFEQGDYPTSYIPTNGSIATRVADTASKTGLQNYINSSEGVLCFEVKVPSFTTNSSIALSDGTLNNYLRFFFRSNEYFGVVSASNSVSQINTTTIPTQYNKNQYYKVAISYKTNKWSLWVDGNKLLDETNSETPNVYDTPLNLSNIRFDAGGGTVPFYGNVKDLRVYNEALSDSELQTLTS